MFLSILITTRWALISMVIGSVIVATLLPSWRWGYELFHRLVEGGDMQFTTTLPVIHKEQIVAIEMTKKRNYDRMVIDLNMRSSD